MSEIKHEAAATEVNPAGEIIKDYKFGFHEEEKHAFRTKRG